MEYTATAKYIRTSPRKLRLIARAISGKKVTVALHALSAMAKHAAEPMTKVVASAVANATQKKATVENLMVATIDVMGAPALKRWHAVSKGSAHAFKKRMTHVKVVLTEVEKKGN